MNYKDLLEMCKKQPGLLGTREQKDALSDMKYKEWAAKESEKLEPARTGKNK